LELSFHAGTLEIRGVSDPEILPESCLWDARSGCYRAQALLYAEIVMRCVRQKISYEDKARAYSVLEEGLKVRRSPRPFQTEALERWKRAHHQGLVILPTGSGKSYVGQLAIDAVRRSSLVVVPTLDLVQQWSDQLRVAFGCPVGVIGGGEYSVEPITVTTYDSAYIYMEHLGDRFGLVIFDECHHLPGEAYALAARSCLAPFRLGLTATPERVDGRHIELLELVGDLIYRIHVEELAGEYLAPYQTERISVDLSPDEWDEYERERSIYRNFVRSQGIRFSSPGGWTEFIQRSARSQEGRRAMKAYQRQRRLAFAAPSKLEYVEYLLAQHHKDKILLFTQNNDTAYEVSRRFLIPVITHQTRPAERSELLAGFGEGRYRALATSKVLNEGVDVPDANVAIVISGSGSVREHVQRLGRILRKQEGKQAMLYELVAADTAETFTSDRRREHSAYR